MSNMWGPGRLAPLAVAAVVAMATAGCGGGSQATGAQASDSTSTSTDPLTQAKIAAITAYDNMWAAFVTASLTDDTTSPELRTYASGEALTLLVSGLKKNEQQHVVAKGQPVLRPRVTQLIPAATPTKAVISDTVDDSHWLFYRTNGALENSTPGGCHRIQALVAESGGVWKVTRLVIEATGPC